MSIWPIVGGSGYDAVTAQKHERLQNKRMEHGLCTELLERYFKFAEIYSTYREVTTDIWW